VEVGVDAVGEADVGWEGDVDAGVVEVDEAGVVEELGAVDEPGAVVALVEEAGAAGLVGADGAEGVGDGEAGAGVDDWLACTPYRP
jgi:hypothetical protein